MHRDNSRPTHWRSPGDATVVWLLIGLAGGLGLQGCGPEDVASSSVMAPDPPSSPGTIALDELPKVPPPSVEHQTYDLPTSRVQVVTVPPESSRQIKVAVSENLDTLTTLATETEAIAAINAGFFDPQNGLTTSSVLLDGAIVADPQQNPRLMENPDLQAYLPAILDRSEFRIYACGDEVLYDIVKRSAPIREGCLLTGAVGAGPQLLPTMTGYEEGFFADNDAGQRGRDALGSQMLNARSAVGLKLDGTVVLAIATQLPEVASRGLTLPDMANLLDSLGVESALNLDGGSSTGLYFEGVTYFGRLDETGEPIERPIMSILLVR